MADVQVPVVRERFDARVRPPGSKSLTNRALVCAALADGESRLTGVLDADDTRHMIDNLRGLGFELAIDGDAVMVGGRGGKVPAASADLFCGNSGTTIRFLTALCTLGDGAYSLDGIERMRQRPIRQLADLLNTLGADVACVGDCPPVTVNAAGLPGGGGARYDSRTSSQYLSAALMVGPYARDEVQIELGERQTSWPYVRMTMRLMDLFGVTPEVEKHKDTGEPTMVAVPRGVYRARELAVEPDASAATYFLALAALHEGSRVTVEGLGAESLQGDTRFADLLARAGAEVEVRRDTITVTGTGEIAALRADFADMPDAAQTYAAVALFADGPTLMTGLHTLTVKETDRLAALKAELTKLGATVEATGDTLRIEPPKAITPARIATYDDHRMAMSFALVGTRAEGVVIEDAGCVSKTYPRYFDDLAAAVAEA